MAEVQYERLMKPSEVARLFYVDPRSVTRWANTGRLESIRTPGGHRRFREAQVMELYRREVNPKSREITGGNQ